MLTKSDLRVIQAAIQRSRDSGRSAMNIRTTAVIELGAPHLVPPADMAQLENTPELERDTLTSLVNVDGLAAVIEIAEH